MCLLPIKTSLQLRWLLSEKVNNWSRHAPLMCTGRPVKIMKTIRFKYFESIRGNPVVTIKVYTIMSGKDTVIINNM